jgi:hypothetical protein
MKKEQAIEILVQAVHVAQSRGAFQLEEAATLFQAIGALKEEPKPDAKEKPLKATE